MAKNKKNSVHYQGFTMVDEVFLKLMGGLIQTKIHETLATLEKREIQQEVLATMKMAGLITTPRSYSEFLTEAKQALP